MLMVFAFVQSFFGTVLQFARLGLDLLRLRLVLAGFGRKLLSVCRILHGSDVVHVLLQACTMEEAPLIGGLVLKKNGLALG